jgi:hypothetical protein
MEAILFVLVGLFVGGLCAYIYAQKTKRSELAVKEREEQELRAELVGVNQKIAVLTLENQMLNEAKKDQVMNTQIKVTDLDKTILQLRNEKDSLSKKVTEFEQNEPIRQNDYDKKITQLNQARENFDRDCERELQKKIAAEEARLKVLRETWSRHENEVEEKMGLICQQLGIEYIDKEKFPYKGKPDNCVKICSEYIIFDSKSPQGEDLSNFSQYIKSQAEAAEKYAKNDEVKKDIFLIVPTNAIEVIPETYLPRGSHRVHVITIDSLRAVLMQLKKIEEYEFVDKLSPEDHESIVTFIGKMVHRIKRGIQVDCYMNNDLMSLLIEADNLPKDILEGSQKVEQHLILNPAQQKRAKKIDIEVLKKDTKKLAGQASGQEINLSDDLKAIEGIPLYIKGKGEAGKEQDNQKSTD